MAMLEEGLTIVHDDAVLKIAARQAQSGDDVGPVLLSFTGIGHAMGGIDVQKPEFFGVGRSFSNIVFITDKTRSWGNALDFELIARILAPLVGSRETFAIGNSLGGFNAIVASSFLPIKTVIAFAPQFSVNPACVPWEKRWIRYRSEIRDFRIDDAGGYMVDGTTYFLFSGSSGHERLHAKKFPVGSNIHHTMLLHVGHDVAATLKEKGLLAEIVQACLSTSGVLEIALPHEGLSPPNLRDLTAG